MSSPPLTYDLPDRYLKPITERQLALLERRRAIAVESPLGSTVKLAFTSSNLHPESTVDVALLNEPDHPSPNPLRPVTESLLHRLERSPSDLEIKLLKTLQSGADQWSQVWTATVEGEGKVYGKVVVKLLVESLYPFPDGSWVNEEVEVFDWWSAKWFESREARAYAAFRALQGRDVPICYGFYRFRMPWGEDVVGIVLEDLSDPKIAVTFEDCYKFNLAKHGQLTVGGIDPIVCRMLETQRRLQDSELVDFGFSGNDILVLNTTTESDPHVVFLDFGRHRRKETLIKCFEAKPAVSFPAHLVDAVDAALVRRRKNWRGVDEGNLIRALAGLIGRTMDEWSRMELVRNKLGIVAER